jgi:hypothetical protein
MSSENITPGSSGPKKINRARLQIALEHARAMFVYHAGQRHNHINFFLTALGLAIGGTAAAFGKLSNDKPGVTCLLLSLGGATVIVLSWCFWKLDERNAFLVECDERALRKAEAELAQLPNYPEFETIKKSDAWPEKGMYRKIMPKLFKWFIFLGVVAIIAAYPYFHDWLNKTLASWSTCTSPQ